MTDGRGGFDVSVVLPAFNGAPHLAENVRAILRFFEEHRIDGQVVVADDGSTDGSPDMVPPAPNVVLLRLPHRGKGAALRAGMLAATGEIRAFTDADLPYGVEPLLVAMRYIREHGFHVVIGDRTLPGSDFQNAGPVRELVSAVASLAFRTLLTGGIHDTQCGFKVFRGDVAAELFRLARVDGFAIDVELIHLALRHHLDLKGMPVRLRRNAPSSVRIIRDSLLAARDVARIRWNVVTGRYRSPVLADLLERELRDDIRAAGLPAGADDGVRR